MFDIRRTDNGHDEGYIFQTTARSGPWGAGEIRLLRMIDKVFDDELMGIEPGTSKFMVLRIAVNRSGISLSDWVKRTPNAFKPRLSKGLVRDRDVTRRLESSWPENLRGSIPTIPQLLARFSTGRHLKMTFATEPPSGYSVTTIPIPTDHIPVGGIRPICHFRVSSDPQEDESYSLESQDKMSNGHIYFYKDVEQTTIPVGGIPCFSETNGVWTGPSHALLHFLNDPILSRLDNNGQNITFNTVVECYVDRVGRDLAIFDIIQTAFRERGVSIWCLHEQIGSLTHLDYFRGRIQIAEDFSTLLSSKVKRGRNVKGLRNCSPHEPTSSGDGWGPLEDKRLIQFKLPHTNIPPQYYRPATTRAKGKIEWHILRQIEFPLRTADQIQHRVLTLSVHGLRTS
jgi:hypothetical protein